jgi:RNA polymerase sigma-54 factor
MLKQSLSQKMLQKLSPQQIQLMKLLQLPTTSLEERISEELESNPALEEADDYSEVIDLDSDSDTKEEAFELDDYINEYIEDDPQSYKLKDTYSHSSEEDYRAPVVVQNSFHDYLDRQLGMLDLPNEEQEIIAEQLIGSIDEDGYLRRDPESIIDDLLFSQNIEVQKETVVEVLHKIQQFDPPGVAARDLQECLAIQMNLKLKNIEGFPEKKYIFAQKIIENHFTSFTKKHYERLKKNLFLSESELKEAIGEIIKLNPKPALSVSEVSSSRTQYILPDFFIKNRDGELELSLNNKNAPDLKINDQYVEMIKSYRDSQRGEKSNKNQKDAVMFIKQKIDSAKWFIDAIKQRHHTLYSTMYAILQFQYDFFLTGDDRRIKPMILKDIAEITGLDISTVSRVANSKFVQTEFGTRKLKSFFSESMTTQEGEEVSTLEVKNILKDIVARENKRKPHSDEKLKVLLEASGYSIARRTVAKYREQLHIPVARLRKEL